ncbi:MAG: DNA primase noncatalytic subunit PriX [Candidatus Marsarchaeota archaeon]|jgi:hypothetical protein|nr:DNA primase noncatalytic subunit PriX [Candidatus Marsarchaeota archaeon]MCL5111701.1 DNA primase noncatalytic subunit PriX [Candidatus Marsarchaeota archaeon]
MAADDALAFAYKYPFSEEAKAVVRSKEAETVGLTEKYLVLAERRLGEAFAKGRLEYKDIAYGKLDHVISYVYERMLVSALGNRAAILKFASAEASRSRAALDISGSSDMLRLSAELGIAISPAGLDEYKVGFLTVLRYMSSTPRFSLSNFKLHGGDVMMRRRDVADLLESVIFRQILKGLPIKHGDLPQQVIARSKTIVQPVVTIRPAAGGNRAWIDKLLETPIPDVRHRVVNLVLAPYLINVRGMTEDDAFKAISSYIERCKALDPNTRINDSYIKYQCSYAKRKGLRPLSLARAKELLGDYVDFDTQKEKVVVK